MIYDKIDVKINTPCALALGYFDGVHLGHQSVINAAVKKAKSDGIKSAVFTFTDKKRLCKKKAERGEVYTREKSVQEIRKLGVDFIFMPDFESFCGLSPSEFVELLCKNLCVKAFFCGEDYRFGKNAKGNVETLKKEAENFGAELYVLKKQIVENIEVSSTAVAAALKKGNVCLAKKLLGRE